MRVQCPEMEGSDKLIGQLLEVEVASLQVRRMSGQRNEERGQQGGSLGAATDQWRDLDASDLT